MATNNEHTPGQEEFSKLLGDLRSMPRVSAPTNFEFLLQQTIQAQAQPRTSWWKRFFRSSLNLGGFQVPAYAFTGATAAVVVTVSVIVINRTDFQSQLDKAVVQQPAPQVLTQEQSISEQPTQGGQLPPQEPLPPDQPVASAPAPEKDRLNEDKDNSKLRQSTLGASRQEKQTGAKGILAVPPAPAVQLKSDNKPAEEAKPGQEQKSAPASHIRINDDFIPRTRGTMEDESANESRDEKETLKDKEQKLDKREEYNIESKSTEKPADAAKKENRRDSDRFKSMLLEGNSLVAKQSAAAVDSARIKDSLRKVDSLRALKRK